MVELRGSIVIGDPDHAERADLIRVLGGEGFLPFEAQSRSEALALARELSPDLALLDAYFPDGSGLDACERLRALTRGMRVIVFTGDPSRELRRDALCAGAYAVVPKPLRRRVVLATVEAALGCGPRWGWH